MARFAVFCFSLLLVMLPVQASPLALSEKAAIWQLSHIGTPIPHQKPETYPAKDWVMGAFYVGLAALADHSKDPRFAEAIRKVGEEENWQLGPRLFHGDDQVIGQSWIWAYTRFHDPKMIAPLRARFDAIIAAAPDSALDFGKPAAGMEDACQVRWCWADALFMAPPAWFALSRTTGDAKYAAYAGKEYRATTAKLFSPEDHLFYRDSRFFTKTGPHGERIYWARGNGWVYAGLARILSLLPENAPERAFYADLFRKMSAKLITLQKPDGYWPVSLLGPKENTPPETSGTGFFTYGLAYGVAHGLLPEPQYRQAALRGWSALSKAVDADGRLGWVQPIGSAPDAVTQDDTQPFGVGAFLLAGTAMAEMEK